VELTVRYSDHVEILRRKAELEAALAGEVSRRNLAEQAASQAHQELEQMRPELAKARASIIDQEQEIRRLRSGEARYHRMFSDALSQLQGLNSQVEELRRLLTSTNEELGAARASGRLGAILSGIAAVTGAATLAYFAGRNSETENADAKPKGAKKRK
jgi:chromosome segregation ATPase